MRFRMIHVVTREVRDIEESRIADLQGQGFIGTLPVGTTAERPSTADQLEHGGVFIDTTIDAVILATGDGWVTHDGKSV